MPSDGAPEIAVYSLRIDRALLDRLTEIANENNRTIAGEFRQMVSERIASHDRDREAA